MPTLSRWFLKTGLVYLIAALGVGVFMRLPFLWGGYGLGAALWPVFVHLLVVGWITQLIFGVAYWMFPKYSREKPRGSERLGYLSYGLLNSGLLLRGIAEPMQSLSPGAWWGWLLVISAVLQWMAGIAFVGNTWGRVKGR